ncbi:putative DNA primase/helicase [Desulfonatronum zhilinae]|nr:putative DNA primase/helicase [Desulfonatronum zhilinae]
MQPPENENPGAGWAPGQGEKLAGTASLCPNLPGNASFSRDGILKSLASIRSEIERRPCGGAEMSDHTRIQEFQSHIEAAGLRPGHVLADGTIHRCPVENKPGAKDGAYILHLDAPCSGYFCNHRTGESGTWTASNTEGMSQADRDRIRQRIDAARAEAQRQREADQQAAAERARTRYDRARPASPDHPYLIKKGIKPLPGLRQSGNLLIVPIMDEAGKIVSLQYISPDGQKRFLKGGKTGGGLFAIKGSGTLAVGEGLATNATIHEAKGWTVLVAFNAGNLRRVAEIARKRYPDRRIIICADNDTETQGNPGLNAAQDAARAVSGLLAVPDMGGRPCDWNDYHQAHGLETARAALEQATPPPPPEPNAERDQKAKCPRMIVPVSIADFLAMDFPPRRNLLAPWLPAQGLVMVFAARGIGKTFFSLGAAYAVACGGVFLGWQAPRPSGVLYLDGEMPGAVMQERLAALVASSQEPQAPLILVTPDLQPEGMPRLDTTEGQEAVEGILTPDIDLIVVDNISTLTCTKENEADGWTPVQAWALRQRARGRSVLFVHHSGKGGQQRGTSRREDVLDTVLNLRRPVDYEPDQGAVFEVHFEKARGLFGEDVHPIEARLSMDQTGNMTWTTRQVEACNYERVVSLLNEGMSQKDIAVELGLNKSNVSRHAKRAKHEGLVTPKARAES